jgi:uncharacterized membrane protein (UPF0127 family)
MPEAQRDLKIAATEFPGYQPASLWSLVPIPSIISAMKPGLSTLLALAALLGCVACSASQPWVELKGQKFTVDIADTPDEHALGLMFRDEMAADHGMLFIFAREAPRSFWMKNTRIALDIMYFDANLALVSMAENTPPCRTRQCPSYPSTGPAQYVLELNGGTAAELGVSVGDELVLHLD